MCDPAHSSTILHQLGLGRRGESAHSQAWLVPGGLAPPSETSRAFGTLDSRPPSWVILSLRPKAVEGVLVHAVLVGKLGALSGSSWPCKGRMLEWAMISGKGIGQPFCPGHTDLYHGGLQRVWVHRAGMSPQERHGRGSKETVPSQPLRPPMLTMVGPPEL